MEPLICAYCNEQIVAGGVAYKWFPDDKQTKPVHAYHLITNPKERNNAKSHAVDTTNRPEEASK